MSVRFTTCLLNELEYLLFRSALPRRTDKSMRDIVDYGIIEQERLLLNYSDLSPPPFEVQSLEVMITNGDSTR